MDKSPSRVNRCIEFEVAAWILRAEAADFWTYNMTDQAVTSDWRKRAPDVSMGTTHIKLRAASICDDVETWLKQNILTFLKLQHAGEWWHQMPSKVRRNANWRYQMAVDELGTKRAGPERSMRWLSFGDAILLIEKLSMIDQMKLLQSEELRVTWSKAARGVKWFRDSIIAHPTAIPGRFAVSRLCSAAEDLSNSISPSQTRRCRAFIQLLSRTVSNENADQFYSTQSLLGIDYLPSRSRPPRGSVSTLKKALKEHSPQSDWRVTPHDVMVVVYAGYNLGTIIDYFQAQDSPDQPALRVMRYG
ncbi:hypothetical protein ILP97_00490 [Amycolatopsis sp. H6(2020)]|nr:hypothetical protein [Amycolatopsis sp. H6(2020)]